MDIISGSSKGNKRNQKGIKENRSVHAGNEVSLDKISSALAYDVVCTDGVAARHVS
jgi:hypothetical protein